MAKSRLESRLDRLEKRLAVGECEGCNQVAMQRVLWILKEDSRMREQDRSHKPSEPDWSKTDLVRWPVCGNPQPKMSIEFMRRTMGGE
jgi:hypothetical protein